MEKEVGEYFAACPVCATNKLSGHPLAGLLCPLPVPHCRSSHPGFGKAFAPSWALQSASRHQSNGQTECLRLVSVAWYPRIQLHGADILSGLSMPTTTCPVLPLVSLPSTVPMVISRHCSQSWRQKRLSSWFQSSSSVSWLLTSAMFPTT